MKIASIWLGALLFLLPLAETAFASNTLPKALITTPGELNRFKPGVVVPFNGSESYDPDGGAITFYKWYVDGVLESSGGSPSYSMFHRSFTLASGERYRSVTITLEVRDDELSWSSVSRTFTITEVTTYYYITDHVGSIRSIVDDGGFEVSHEDFDPFGAPLPGRSQDSGLAYQQNKFTGHERDSEGGLNLDYMQSRIYDPNLGRFLSVDPLAGEFPMWSPYNYTMNNPLVNIDPDGEFVISFISGFIRGLREDDATFRSAVSEGWESIKNTAQIWSSFGRGDFGQIISKFTWELPQQLAGVTTGVVNNWFGNVRSVSHSAGATLVETQSSGWGGFTLGSIIHADQGTRIGTPLFQHEYGHYLQSQRLGPAYLPVVGAPSLGSAMVDKYNIMPSHDHRQYWTERWADRLSERHFGQTRTQPNLPKALAQRRQEELRRMMLHMRR